MIFTELKSHANVEEWTEATCKEQHFVTKELTGKEYKFWERRHIARYEFMNPTGPEAKDRHHLNNFFLTNGVKLKPGTSVLTEGPPMPKEDDSLDVEIITEGTGDNITEGSIVAMHYTGKHEDGSTFDSSHGRGMPFKFKQGSGQVIKCWD